MDERDPGSDRLQPFKKTTAGRVRDNLPSPHSELLLGMTVGIDRLYEVPKFKKMLRDTGTIHVVVVSGYNVTLVYNAVMRMLGSPYKSRNLSLAVISTLAFSVVSGFEPPVVRAWIMGSVIALGKYYGRKVPALSVLILTGLIMTVLDPGYLYSLSFQLSFLATLSLIMFEQNISSLLQRFFNREGVMLEDLAATLAAQVLIWPYLSFKFGQVSLMSPLVNALVLWTVPLATVLGSIYLILDALSGFLGAFLSFLVYLPLDFFVLLIEHFSKYDFLVPSYKMSLPLLVSYYFVLGIVSFKNRREDL